jgi:hypothetical protein
MKRLQAAGARDHVGAGTVVQVAGVGQQHARAKALEQLGRHAA